MLRQGFDTIVPEGAYQNAVYHARYDASTVFDWLAATQVAIARRHEHGMPTELVHARLERDPGSCRRLFKNHGEQLAAQGCMWDSLFEFPFDIDGVRDQ